MKVLAESSDGLWQLRESHETMGVSWALVHLPSGDTTSTFGWTELSEGGRTTRHGDREVRFAGGAVEVVREDGRTEKVALVWPVPPAKAPDGETMPEGWADYEKRLQAEYKEKLATKDKLEAAFLSRRKA